MIEIIDGEVYGMYTALENALGHEPSKEELLAFEETAEKALNDLLVSDALEEKVPAEPPTDEWVMYAYLRKDLVDSGKMPPLWDVDRDEHLHLDRKLGVTRFPCLQSDDLDGEFNMRIILPDGKMYGAMSIDFDFEPIPEKKTFDVDVNRISYGCITIEVTARTQVEAESLALEEAGNYGFNEFGSEYELA